jgi:hypothetical protein
MDYLLHVKRTGHKRPRGPRADWWVLMTTNAAGTNGLMCFPKHGGARVNKCLANHPKIYQRCLTSAVAQTAGLSFFSIFMNIASIKDALVAFYDIHGRESSFKERGTILLFCPGHYTRLRDSVLIRQ